MNIGKFINKKKENKDKSLITPPDSNYKKSLIGKLRFRYIKTIEDEIFKVSEIQLYDRLKFISVTASESNPSENITKYILRSFAMYLLAIILIVFGVMITVMAILFNLPIMILLTFMFIAIGTFELFKPYDFFKFLVTSEFQKFIKDIGTYIRDQNIVNFYKKKEEELKTQESAVVAEKATTFSSITTLLMFGVGVMGLLLGIGSTIQPIIVQIYNNVMKGFSGGMVSQISTELSLFKMIVGLPPLYYFYLVLFIFAIVAVVVMSKISKKMITV